MTRKVAVPTNNVDLLTIKPELWRVLEALPPSRQAEVLDFARFLYQQTITPTMTSRNVLRSPHIELRVAPATILLSLTGQVALGGDAVTETEALYDNNGYH